MHKLEHVSTNQHQLVNKIKIWILVEYNFDLVQIWLHKSSMGGCLGTAMLLWKKWQKWTQFADVTNICLHVFLVITVLSLGTVKQTHIWVKYAETVLTQMYHK